MRGLVVLLLVAVANAKVFPFCEWVEVLKANGMDGYRNISLDDWVCLTYHASRFNTRATHRSRNQTTNYGIFQINSRWWCDNGTPTANGCNISCINLLSDNVRDAITCAKRVVQDPQGIRAWEAWVNNCQSRDLSSYLLHCTR